MNKTLGPCENISSAPSLDKIQTNASPKLLLHTPPSQLQHIETEFVVICKESKWCR